MRNGAIVVLLESPHAHEYSEQFEPIGPLKNPTSEARLLCFLHRLLSDAESPDDEEERDVVLCNPIQWQTSIFRLLPPCKQVGLQDAIRNTVWKALWTYKNQHGQFVFQREFIDRLTRYGPCLILNACTGGTSKNGPKKLVQELLTATFRRHPLPRIFRRQPLPLRMVSAHPSAWNSNTKIEPEPDET
ncbi:hypothetical protein [Corallococcus terminator]|uniref:hypothetical protein n=1 Tax=Corallococcus terminator TaxID=2316733 RepID=UPI0011C44336|nr:hypothetical protein [Corallococcus terminator]